MFLEENPSIRQTSFILSPTLQYTFDVNHTVTIYTLKKLIAAAARLRKNSFRLFSNQKEYTYYNNESIGVLFPTQQRIVFTIQHSEVEDIDDSNSTIKVRISSYCNEHEMKYLNYYCFTCDKSLCSLCILDPLHKNHDYKEKCDYFQSSKFLVDAAFKQNKNMNLDIDPKKLFSVNDLSQLKVQLKNVLFKKLNEMLANIEIKLNDVIDLYNSTNKISCENLQDNCREIKRFCVKGLEQLKDKIEIRNLLIDENVFLTFHNKYKELASKQEKRIEFQVKQFNELSSLIAKPIQMLVNKTYEEIYEVLNRKLNMKDYEELKYNIKEKMIAEISESEVIKDIIGEEEKKVKRPYSTMVQNISESIQNHAEELRRKSDPKLSEMLNESNPINVSSHSHRSNHNISNRNSIEKEKNGVNNMNVNINANQIHNPFLNSQTSNMNNNTQTTGTFNIHTHVQTSNPFLSNNIQTQEHQHQMQNININHNHAFQHNHNIGSITTPIPIPSWNNDNKADSNININVQMNTKDISSKINLSPFIMAPIREKNEIKILYQDQTQKNKKVMFPVFITPPHFLESCAHCNFDNKLYVSGGIEIKGAKIPSSTLLKYDPTSDSLLKLSNLITPRYNHTMKPYGNYIYVVGGRNNKTCERYNVSLNKWERMPDMKYEREKAMLEVHEGYLYAFFGKNGNGYSENVERIQLNNNTAKWEEVNIDKEEGLSLKMYGCATFLRENDLFFFGGNVNEEIVDTICCFDFEDMELFKVEENLHFKQTFTENNLYLFEKCRAQISDKYIPVIINCLSECNC